MSNTSALVPPAQATFVYWNLLPRELRLLILSKTHLVRRHDWVWNELASAAGPTILDGRLLIPAHVPDDNVCDHAKPELGLNQCNRCLAGHEIPFPIALFTVSSQIYEDASEVFWSQRFVLRGTFGNTAMWLNRLGEERVSRITKMHLVVEGRQVLRVAAHVLWCLDYEDDEDLLTEFDMHILIETIRRKCNLGKLWLSVDVEWKDTISYVWEESSCTRGKSLQENLRRTYEFLFKPLVTNFQGRFRLARFHVFMSWAPECEADTERAVMGGEYNSALDGKLDCNDRDVKDPHRKRPADEAAQYGPRSIRS